MKRIVIVAALACAGCGLENFFSNQQHSDWPRPASAISGAATWNGADKATYFAVDGSFNEVAPFKTSYDAKTGTYQMNLPSSKYTWLIAQARTGNMLLSAIVPQIGQETVLRSVDLNARSTTETLIVVSRLSADGITFKQLTPSHRRLRQGPDRGRSRVLPVSHLRQELQAQAERDSGRLPRPPPARLHRIGPAGDRQHHVRRAAGPGGEGLAEPGRLPGSDDAPRRVQRRFQPGHAQR
ncbi:MAG: hypothetical protein E6J88_05845 [Deltaproteobacteria bacterium]|nr:MAG: hypothetical protein E6J88_05845 [Deltaproteobacteria bacterium]